MFNNPSLRMFSVLFQTAMSVFRPGLFKDKVAIITGKRFFGGAMQPLYITLYVRQRLLVDRLALALPCLLLSSFRSHLSSFLLLGFLRYNENRKFVYIIIFTITTV